MRVIDSGILDTLEEDEIRPFVLLNMEIDGANYRYTDCDIPLVYGGYTYSPRGFKVDKITYSTSSIVDSASFTIDDIDETMKALFVGGTPRGESVVYSQVVLDSNYDIIGGWDSEGVFFDDAGGAVFDDTGGASFEDPAPHGTDFMITLFEGTIDEWGIDETDLKMNVVSASSQWSQRTLARQSASCRWKEFGGTECAYAGAETWCDRTYTRCSALGNTANFGGERWLPSIVDKEVWWGSTGERPVTPEPFKGILY